MCLTYSSQPDPRVVTQTASGPELVRASSQFGVGYAGYVSVGVKRIYAFGRARQVVGLIEMLGFRGFGGYRLALNARHDAAFSSYRFGFEVETAAIMLPDLLTDPRYGKPGHERFVYGALLVDRYGPDGTGAIAEVRDVGEFALDPGTGLPVVA